MIGFDRNTHPDRAAAFEGGPLRLAHVLAFPADVGFVDFNRAGEVARLVLRPDLAESVEHEPSGLLSDLEIAVQLHRGDALEAGGLEVDGEDPLAERNLRAFEGGAGFDGEVGATVCAAVGRLSMAGLVCADAAAPGAATATGPHLRLEPEASGFLVGEQIAELHQRDPFAPCLAGSLVSHASSPSTEPGASVRGCATYVNLEI